MALIKCPECGKIFSDKAPECPQCGLPTSEAVAPKAKPQRVCPECGQTIEEDAEDCPKCGFPLSEAAGPIPPAPPAVQPPKQQAAEERKAQTPKPEHTSKAPSPQPQAAASHRSSGREEPKRKGMTLWILMGVVAVLAAGAAWLIFGHKDSEASKPQGSVQSAPSASSTERTAASVPASDESGRRSTDDGPERRTYAANGVQFTMVTVEGGTFTMGATPEQMEPYDDEWPTRRVTLSTFAIGETEVTQALWQAVMGSNPSKFVGENLPVESVSWDDCQTFIRRLNNMTSEHFRLPTEAEWEYAARGGQLSKGYQFSGSNRLDEVAWYGNNSDGQTHPVGTKLANELGLYDMSGNVFEWCQDWYGSYNGNDQTDPTGPGSGSKRVDRGGCWVNYARSCRVTFRGYFEPSERSQYLGLRLVLSNRPAAYSGYDLGEGSYCYVGEWESSNYAPSPCKVEFRIASESVYDAAYTNLKFNSRIPLSGTLQNGRLHLVGGKAGKELVIDLEVRDEGTVLVGEGVDHAHSGDRATLNLIQSVEGKGNGSLFLRTFTEKETDTSNNVTYQADLPRKQMATNLKSLGFRLADTKTEQRLDYTGEEYYTITIETYSRTENGRTTTVKLESDYTEIRFPGSAEVNEFIKTVRDGGLRSVGNGRYEDTEEVYWAGTDVTVEGTKVTLSYRWEP